MAKTTEREYDCEYSEQRQAARGKEPTV
jgi:hypothetical protein